MGAAPSASAQALRRLLLVQVLSMGAMEMSAPFWPIHLRDLGGLSPEALAWASSAAYAGPMVMALCFTPWWGRLGDRVGHKPMVMRALLALAATQLVIALADNIALALTARLTQGALGGFIAAAQAYAAGLVEPRKRSGLMAHLQVATAVGSALGPWLGGWLMSSSSFGAVNAVAAGVCLLCAACVAFALPAGRRGGPPNSPHAGQEAEPPDAQPPVVWSALYGLLLGIALVQTAKTMPQVFFALYAEQVLLASPALAGLCYGAMALGLCVAAPLWGRWFERQTRAQVLQRVGLICWACAAILAVQAAWPDTAVFLVARLLWGVCLGALLPVFYALLSRETASGRQGAVLGAGNSAAKAGALLGTAAGGLALAWLPLQDLFWPVAALYAAAAIGMRWLRPQSLSTDV